MGALFSSSSNSSGASTSNSTSTSKGLEDGIERTPLLGVTGEPGKSNPTSNMLIPPKEKKKDEIPEDRLVRLENEKNINAKINNYVNELLSLDDDFTQEYGVVNMISFLCAIWSRLAYMSDRQFLACIEIIFNSVIPVEMLTDINNHINIEGIKGILNDEEMFNLSDMKEGEKKYGLKILNQEKNHKFGEKGLQFLKWAQIINVINSEERISSTEPNCKPNVYITPDDNIVFSSIATSNYGNIYVWGDKRMPNLVVIIFRGTYSAKSATSYLNPDSVFPAWTGLYFENEEKFLYGMYKILFDVIHILMQAIQYVSERINPTGEFATKILTTGHSLGGALATMFAYVYTLHINKRDYHRLDENIACISLGAPRCLNVQTAKIFCCFTSNFIEENRKCNDLLNVDIKNRITYLRITSYNDPIPGLPVTKSGFVHPCSTTDFEKNRKAVNMDCFVQIANSLSKRCLSDGTKIAITPNRKLPLKCVDEKRNAYISSGSPVLGNTMGYHTEYLGISFAGALDLYKIISNEIKRQGKDTVCRLIVYPKPILEGAVVTASDNSKASCIFYNLVKNRRNEAKMINIDILNKLMKKVMKKVSEDIYDNEIFFNEILHKINDFDYDIINEEPSLEGNILGALDNKNPDKSFQNIVTVQNGAIEMKEFKSNPESSPDEGTAKGGVKRSTGLLPKKGLPTIHTAELHNNPLSTRGGKRKNKKSQKNKKKKSKCINTRKQRKNKTKKRKNMFNV